LLPGWLSQEGLLLVGLMWGGLLQGGLLPERRCGFPDEGRVPPRGEEGLLYLPQGHFPGKVFLDVLCKNRVSQLKPLFWFAEQGYYKKVSNNDW
jgi:hypothetical protein